MIETELEALNFPDAPKMITAGVPGPKSAAALELSALVEESAAAAESLNQQSSRLAGVVGTFKLV
jgi:4-aminobutyrate aminotransferase